MKKLLIALVCALLLSGCSNANVSLSNGKKAVMKIGNDTITNDDLFYMLMYAEYGSLDAIIMSLEDEIQNRVAPLDEAIEKDAQEIVDSYKKTYGEYFETIISFSGYQTEEEFYENSAIPQARYLKTVGKYVDLKFSTLSVLHKPRKIQVAVFSTEENATKALDELKNGKELASLISEFEAEKTYDGSEFVVTSSYSSLDADVLSIVSATAINGPIASVLAGSDKKFYVVNMVEADPEKFKEEAVKAIASTVNLSEDVLRHYLKEYNFKITDTYTYNMFKTYYPDYILD